MEFPPHPRMKIGCAPSDPVEFALWQYASLAHGDRAAHPLDWGRFYRFVVLAHVRRKGWDAGNIETLLRNYGFSSEKAKEMAEVYWHGRCVLRVRSKSSKSDYSGWLKKGGFRLT